MQYRSMQMLKVPHVDAKLHPSNSKTIPFLIAVAEKTVDRFRWCRLCMFVQLFIFFLEKTQKIHIFERWLWFTQRCTPHDMHMRVFGLWWERVHVLYVLSNVNIFHNIGKMQFWLVMRSTQNFFIPVFFFGIKHLFGQIPLLWPQRNQRLAPLGGIPTVQMYLSPQMRET